jgi:hypothetical protein
LVAVIAVRSRSRRAGGNQEADRLALVAGPGDGEVLEGGLGGLLTPNTGLVSVPSSVAPLPTMVTSLCTGSRVGAAVKVKIAPVGSTIESGPLMARLLERAQVHCQARQWQTRRRGRRRRRQRWPSP